MIILIIVIVILVVSLVIAGFIIIRKFPQLAVLDIDSLPQEKQKQIKSAIIEQRVKRRLGGWTQSFLVLVNPLLKTISQKIKQAYQEVLRLEKYYKDRSTKIKFTKNSTPEQNNFVLSDKMQAITQMIEDGKLVEAESVLISIISEDPKNIEAYYQLADLYYKQKDFQHALELFEHILKIDPEQGRAYSGLAKIAIEQGSFEQAIKGLEKSISLKGVHIDDYINLGKIYQKFSDYQKMLQIYQTATSLEPKNPRVLDLLLEACILNNKKILAKSTLNKLKKVNPDNQKLDDFKKKIDQI